MNLLPSNDVWPLVGPESRWLQAWTRRARRLFQRRTRLAGEPTLDAGSRPADHLVLDGRSGCAYDEEAFWHFLAVERKRVDRSGRTLLLLLVTVNGHAGPGAVMPSPVAAKLFSALWVSVRDMDFTGWYRTGQVAGAVLTQGPGPLNSAALDRIRLRVAAALTKGLPAHHAPRLHVRVVGLRPGSST